MPNINVKSTDACIKYNGSTYTLYTGELHHRVGRDTTNNYYWRTFLYFDLSAISGYISGANLHIYHDSDFNNLDDLLLQVFKSTASEPPTTSDFNAYTGGALGSQTVTGTGSEWHTISLSGIANKNDLAKLLLKDGTTGDIQNIKTFTAYEGGANKSYLEILTRTTEAQDLGLVPVSDGQHTQVLGKYYCSDGLDSSKIRIQISDVSDFSNILYDSGQVDKVVTNNSDFTFLVDWFPSSAGTYYFRVAFWNSDIEGQDPVWKDSSFTVGYPTISSIDYTHNKENYTFTVQVNDSYTKPPAVSLIMDSKGYNMELISRSGTYIYTYQVTVQLERGKHRFHIEAGNVWTTLIDGTRDLYASYRLDRKGIKIFAGERQINAWNITLDLPLLPDVAKVEFDTDEELGSGQVTVLVYSYGLTKYSMDIANSMSEGTTNHIQAVSTIQNYLNQTITKDIKSSDSFSVLEDILDQYPMLDDYSDILTEPIILWSFQDTRANILNKILILNNACAYEQNGHVIVKSNTSTSARLKISKNDIDTVRKTDYLHIVNRIKEYYKLIHYPVPTTLFTDYDAANWTGTAENIQQTTNGLAAPSGNLYLLKLTDSGVRAVDFKITDYDFLKMSWCPEGGTSLEMRLETDASNYYTYTKTFAGDKGSGFVLSGASSSTDELSKTISASIYIASLTVYTATDVSVKVKLLKSGATVYESGYLDTTNKKAYFSFPNYEIDTITLTFTNLSVIGTSYGITVNQLAIQKYYQVYEVTGTKKEISYQHTFDDYYSFGSKVVLYNTGMSYHLNKSISLGVIPPPSAGQTLLINGSAQVHYNYIGYDGELHSSGDTSIPVTFYRNSNSQLVAKIDTTLYPSDYWYETDYFINKILIQVNVTIEKITTLGQYVWKYAAYPWLETYNLFETFQIPLSKFTTTGSPSEQINNIRLVATGIQNFDQVYVGNNLPRVYSVEVKSDDWTEANDRFQERKLDDVNSYENAKAFAEGLIAILKDPIISYEKTMNMGADISLGDFYNCDGQILHVYRISMSDKKIHIQIGRSIQDTIQYLKETSTKLKALEKNIM